MTNRNLRCVIADLTSRSAVIREIEAPAYGINAGQTAARTAEDAASVVLSTGVLTGTGVPGSGVMGWRGQDGRTVFTEGKLGAYLRYAGADALALTGRSKAPVAVCIENGELTFEDAPPDMRTLRDRFLTANTVIAVPGPEGILESSGFYIADKALADRLRSMGAAAIVLTGTGGIPLADSKDFLDTVLELYRRIAASPYEAEKPAKIPAVRFLSAGAGAEPEFLYAGPAQDGETVLDAALGLRFPDKFDRAGREKYICRLLQACTGAGCTEHDLDELRGILAEAIREEGTQ